MSSTAVVFDILAKDRASDKFDHLGNAIDGSSGKMSKFTGVMKTAGKAAAIGLGLGLAGAAVAAFKFGEAAALDEQAAGLMANAFRNSAGATDEQIDATERWITAQGIALGVTDDDLRPALSRLVSATHDVDEAQKLASLAMDISADRGKSLTSVSEALMKAQNGNVAALSRMGINTKNAAGETITMEQAVKRMSDTFGGAAAQKAGTLQGKMARLKVILSETGEAIGSRLLPVASDLADFFLNHIVPAADDVVGAIKPIAKLGFGKLREAAGNIKDFFQSAKGHAAVATSMAAMGTAAGAIKTGFQKAREAINNIRDALSGIDLGSLDSKQIGTLIGDAVASGLNALVDMVGPLTKALGEMFAKVDWVGLGIDLGKQVPALLTGLAVGILAFDPMPILVGLKDHWGDVLIAVLAIAFAPAKIAGGLGRILAKIPFVGKFLERAVVWLNELGGKFTGMLGRFMSSAWKGFVSQVRFPGAGIVTKIVSALRGIPEAVRGFFSDLGAKLFVWSDDAAGAIGRGFGKGLVSVLRFVSSIPGKILSAIGNLSKFLFPKGSAAIAGFWDGVKRVFVAVLKWHSELPGRVLGAVGNVSRLLYDAGVSIIQGLIDGITSKAKDLYGKLKEITDKIPFHKGPLDKDKILLKPAGVALMEGLVAGIDKGKVKLEATLDKLTNYIQKHQGKLSNLLSKRHDIIDAFKGFASSLFGADTGFDASKQRQDEIASLNDGILDQQEALSKAQTDLAKATADGQVDAAADAAERIKDIQADIAEAQGKVGSIRAEDAAAPKGLDALLAFQSNQKAKAQQLQADVGSLIGKGISDDLLTQLQGAGEAGEEQIHLLAGATAEQLKQANDDNAATQAALQAAGLATSKALGIEEAIKQEERDLKLAQGIKGALKELLDEQDKNTVVELHLDGHKILWSLKKIKRANGGHLGLGDTDKD